MERGNPHRLPVRVLLLASLLPSIARPGFASWLIPGASYIARPILWLWHGLLPWLARHVFHLSGLRATFFPTGSGDTTLDYIQNLLFVVIAIVAAIIWSALDRKRDAHLTLHGWLRILLRFTLAGTLFSYGFSKIIPLQFQPPNLMRLTESYGASSPMGLLWTFMGASMPYTIISGLAEALAGYLLLFRRTALLGALFAAGVLLNIFLVNFCYDVPVKLYSSNLLLMAIFLMLPDLSRTSECACAEQGSSASRFNGAAFSETLDTDYDQHARAGLVYHVLGCGSAGALVS